MLYFLCVQRKVPLLTVFLRNVVLPVYSKEGSSSYCFSEECCPPCVQRKVPLLTVSLEECLMYCSFDVKEHSTGRNVCLPWDLLSAVRWTSSLSLKESLVYCSFGVKEHSTDSQIAGLAGLATAIPDIFPSPPPPPPPLTSWRPRTGGDCRRRDSDGSCYYLLFLLLLLLLLLILLLLLLFLLLLLLLLLLLFLLSLLLLLLLLLLHLLLLLYQPGLQPRCLPDWLVLGLQSEHLVFLQRTGCGRRWPALLSAPRREDGRGVESRSVGRLLVLHRWSARGTRRDEEGSSWAPWSLSSVQRWSSWAPCSLSSVQTILAQLLFS